MIIDWQNTEVTGIPGIRIEMPNEANISIFTDNNLTHITDDHFEINLITHLLDQIYVVPSPQYPRGMMMLHQMIWLLHSLQIALEVQQHLHL